MLDRIYNSSTNNVRETCCKDYCHKRRILIEVVPLKAACPSHAYKKEYCEREGCRFHGNKHRAIITKENSEACVAIEFWDGSSKIDSFPYSVVCNVITQIRNLLGNGNNVSLATLGLRDDDFNRKKVRDAQTLISNMNGFLSRDDYSHMSAGLERS